MKALIVKTDLPWSYKNISQDFMAGSSNVSDVIWISAELFMAISLCGCFA
jgi:hypothetical protein